MLVGASVKGHQFPRSSSFLVSLGFGVNEKRKKIFYFQIKTGSAEEGL